MSNLQSYKAILADPPWSFATYSHKGKGRSPDAHYDTMTFDEIKALPVGQWAAPDCVLFLWVTNPTLQAAFEVINAWGFTYKTVAFTWAKCCKDGTITDQKHPIGNGYWTRANPEHCLLATHGNPERLNADVRALIVSPRREHSQKPDEIYDRIERLVAGPYLEMFARQRRPGWDAFGLEADTGVGGRRWRSDEYPSD